MTDPLLPDIDKLVAKYDDWHECDEYHIHDGTGEHEGATPLPHDFDDEQFKQAIKSEIIRMLEGYKSELPEAVQPREDSYTDGWNEYREKALTALDELIGKLK